jgi:hypothetical protein
MPGATSRISVAYPRRSFFDRIKCDAVPASAITGGAVGTLDEIAFGFRLADHRLVSVTTLAVGLDAAAASRA